MGQCITGTGILELTSVHFLISIFPKYDRIHQYRQRIFAIVGNGSCQYWYGHLASAHTGNERHRGSANTGMGTDRCPILELNRACTGIDTVFCIDGTMALDQPQRGEDDQHRH